MQQAHQPMPAPAPRTQENPAERIYSQVQVVLRDGRDIIFGRCSLLFEPLPSGTTLLTVLAKGKDGERDSGDRMVIPLDMVATIECQLAKLQGAIS